MQYLIILDRVITAFYKENPPVTGGFSGGPVMWGFDVVFFSAE